MTLEQYSNRKHEAEMRRMGYVEYAAVVIEHVQYPCYCNGDNPACRQVIKREWRKPAPLKVEA